jgi:hypothetical protein
MIWAAQGKINHPSHFDATNAPWFQAQGVVDLAGG